MSGYFRSVWGACREGPHVDDRHSEELTPAANAGPSATTFPGPCTSDVASAWARSLRLRYGIMQPGGKMKWIQTGIPAVSAKAVLNAVTNYVDENGCCFPSISTLEDDTDQSYDSVSKRLGDLEFLGLIARFPQWRDEKGALNKEGRGRQTASEIRLMFEVTQEEIDARLATRITGAKEDVFADAGEPAGEPETAPEQMDLGVADCDPSAGLGVADCDPSPEGLGVAPVRGAGSQQCDPLKLQSNQIFPQKPPSLESAAKEAAEPIPEAKGLAEWLQAFRETYPTPSNKPDQVEQVARSLSPDERKRALEGARGVKAYKTRNERFSVVHQQNYLRSPVTWAEFAKFAPPPPPAPPVFAPADNARCRAWQVFQAMTGGAALRMVQHEGAIGAFLPDRDPPCGVGYARFWGAVELFRLEGWVFAVDQSHEWFAWAKKLKEWTGKWPEAELLLVSDAKIEHRDPRDGKMLLVSDRRRGRFFPCQWPLSKDGASGTPTTLMTADDQAEFTKGL